MNFKMLARVMRFPNLLIIFLTQLLCWYCLIRPLTLFSEQPLFLSGSRALLLALATTLIAGAGYIINDYFDVRIDTINRPDKSLIGKDINPKEAIVLHTVCNAVGLSIFAYLAYLMRQPMALTIPVICTILLWFYSTHFKRQFVIGNVVVSLLTALSILILPAFEPTANSIATSPFLVDVQGKLYLSPLWALLVYSGFAFLLNWIREVVKDLEDFKGDAADGCITMPIKIGMAATHKFIKVLLALTLIILIVASIALINKGWWLPALYICGLIISPLVWIMLRLDRSTQSTHYARLSKLLKWIMVAGIATLILLYLYQYHS